MLSAAFFVASLIHVPVGPSNVHLILNGIIGLLLGWGAFPSILIALALQSIFFQFGGITTLGVNTVIMALPAVICYLFAGNLLNGGQTRTWVIAFCCGFLSVLMSSILVGCALLFTEEDFLEVSAAVVLAHLPVMIIEGIITALCVGFLRKVQPSLLPGRTT
jgi:cobalt/nickel transport system permease protein